MPNFADIKQITYANYYVNVSWDYVEDMLDSYNTYNLNLEPEFQRGPVWNDTQRSRYVEWILRGGRTGRDILFNCPGWMGDFKGPMLLVDGLQRLTAVRRFLNNEVKAFGYYRNEYQGTLRLHRHDFLFYVNDLNHYKDVLQWYLDINSGGVVHDDKEIARVRELLNTVKKDSL